MDEVTEKQTEVSEETIPQAEAETPEAAPEAESYPRFEAHIRGLEEQAEALKTQFPEFNLADALGDPVFLQLTAPGTGISVEDAYYALHRKEIQESARKQAREQVVSAISSGARRPLEAGTSAQGPSLTTFRYGDASREQREAFKKELRRAWGRGETVYPR